MGRLACFGSIHFKGRVVPGRGAMANYSVVAQDGQLYGPVDENGLAEWVRQGRVGADTMLHCHDNNGRYVASAVPALRPALGLSPQQVGQLLNPQQQAYPQQPAYGQPQQGFP